MSDDKTKILEQLELIRTLRRDYDHAFLSREGVLHFTRQFGFEARTRVHTANPDEPKGLTLADSADEADGLAADEIAFKICQHLKLDAPPMMGRGFRLRACCDVIERHLQAQL